MPNTLHHFIFAFDDTTVEAFADQFDVRVMVRSIATTLREMTTRLAE